MVATNQAFMNVSPQKYMGITVGNMKQAKGIKVI